MLFQAPRSTLQGLILFNKLKELNMSGQRVAHIDYEVAVYYSDKTGGVRHTVEWELAQEPDGGGAAQGHQHRVGRANLDQDALGF